jgi:hypothetical protein
LWNEKPDDFEKIEIFFPRSLSLRLVNRKRFERSEKDEKVTFQIEKVVAAELTFDLTGNVMNGGKVLAFGRGRKLQKVIRKKGSVHQADSWLVINNKPNAIQRKEWNKWVWLDSKSNLNEQSEKLKLNGREAKAVCFADRTD